MVVILLDMIREWGIQESGFVVVVLLNMIREWICNGYSIRISCYS